MGIAAGKRKNPGGVASPGRRRSRYLGLLVLLLAFLVLSAGGGAWILYRAMRAELDRQLGQRLMAIAATVGRVIGEDRLEQLQSGEDPGALARIRGEFDRLATDSELQNVLVVDSARVVLFDLSGRRPMREIDPVLMVEPELAAVLLSGEPRATRLVAVEGLPGEYFRTGYAAIEDPSGRILGAVGVEGGSGFFAALSGMRQRLLWFLGSAAAVAGALLFLIARLLRSFVRYEDSLQRAAALAAIGQISALVAHEVKNPLAIIRSRSERVRARIEAGKDPREILEWFDVIPNEVDRLDAILTNYLSLARPEAETEGTSRPARVVAETLELLRSEFERRDLRVEMDPAGADPGVAMGARSLKQVLLNLLLNAAQATEAGGTIRVRRTVEGGWVVLEVSDTGRGMTDEELRRAAEPFYTTKPTGSGLGLTLVQSLVEARGGRVELRSSPGKGTRVRVLLPAAAAEIGKGNG